MSDVAISDEEIRAKRRILRQQLRMIRDGQNAVFCGNCGERIPLELTFKCFYCHISFCRVCAKAHFATEPDSPCNTEERESLAREVERLRQALAPYADKTNWARHGVALIMFLYDTNGPFIAFDALHGQDSLKTE